MNVNFIKTLIADLIPQGGGEYNRGFFYCQNAIIASIDHYEEMDEQTHIENLQEQIAQLNADIQYLQEQNMLYVAYHNTEKTMREFAELDLSKFKRIFGRIFWLKK